MATRELESSVAVSSFDVVEVTKYCELSEVVFLWFKPIKFKFNQIRSCVGNWGEFQI